MKSLKFFLFLLVSFSSMIYGNGDGDENGDHFFAQDSKLVNTLSKNQLRLVVLCNFQSSNNVADIVTSTISPGYALTTEGLTQLQEAIPVLSQQNISRIYTSPAFRTQETISLLGATLNLQPNELIVDSRLATQNFGTADGENYNVYKASYSSEEDMLEGKPSQGESGHSVYSRTDDFLQSLSYLQNQTVLIVTHAFNYCHVSKALTGKYGAIPMPGTYHIYDFNNP